MFKRLISSVMAVVLLTGLLAACSKPASEDSGTDQGANQSSSAKKVEIRIGMTSIQDNDTIDPVTGIVRPGKAKLEEILSKVTGYNIKVVPIASSGWIQKLETLLTSDEIDIGRYTNQVQVPNWMEDLTPYLEKDPELNKNTMQDIFLDYPLYYTNYRSFEFPEAYNKIFGLPTNMTHATIVYDEQIFKEWGVEPPKNGASFEEIVEIAKKVHGINPVTGKQNYGLYSRADRLEFDAYSFNAVLPVKVENMNIKSLDRAKYVEPMKDSKELLNYFKWVEQVVSLAPAGITTNSGNEKWLTPDNDIAINITPQDNVSLYRYYIAEQDDITSRFKILNLPLSKDGMQGFPEFNFVGISKNCKNKDVAWEVLKALVTNKEVLDVVFMNYTPDRLPALKDTSGLSFMEKMPPAKANYEFQQKHGLITDDYWFFRTPVQPVISEMLSKKLTPEQARAKTYEEVVKWIENREKLTK